MTITAEILEALRTETGPLTARDLALRHWPRDSERIAQASAVLRRLEQQGLATDVGRVPGKGPHPSILWQAVDPANAPPVPHRNGNRPARPADPVPDVYTYADLKAALGAKVARDIALQVRVAKGDYVVLNEEQIALGRALANGESINKRAASKLLPLWVKFLAENTASRRTLAAWLDALGEEPDDEEDN